MLETISPWLAGALIGGAAVFFAVKKSMSKAGMSVKELVRSQIVDDEFDGRSLLDWAKRHHTKGDIKILVVKPTDVWIKKLNLKDAESIDSQRNLIGYMINAKTDELVSIQLFSFSSMSNTMSQKFGGNDEFVLTA